MADAWIEERGRFFFFQKTGVGVGTFFFFFKGGRVAEKGKEIKQLRDVFCLSFLFSKAVRFCC